MNQQNPQPIGQPNGKKGEMLVRSETFVSFSGPLPPPEVFAKYEQILNGSADRILKMAENQSTHRQFLEKRVISGEQFRANTGLILGFIIGMTVVIGGLTLIYLEKDWQGFVLLVGGIGSLVGTFVYGKKQKKTDLQKKEEELLRRVQELEEKMSSGKKIIEGEATR
jgi:uncharacterized membrane protein